jgi:hypothetical protein
MGQAMAVADLHVSYITLSYYALSIVADDDSGKFLGLPSNADMQSTLCITLLSGANNSSS